MIKSHNAKRVTQNAGKIRRYTLHATRYTNRGFTLIEMMVAVSIFTIVMVMATGALLSILDANRKAQSQQSIFSNLDFALESMSRTIRVGTTYRCVESNGDLNNPAIAIPRDCSGGADAFAFEAFNGLSGFGDQFIYRLNNNQIERSKNGGASFVSVTSPEIIIEGLTFRVRGSEPPLDNEQPVVLISVYGCAGVAPLTTCPATPTKKSVEFNLQTTATQRLLDI